MCLRIDYSFNYKYVLRFLFLHKHDFLFNSYNLPFLDHIFLYFSVRDLDDVDDSRIFNYFYLFKFFFGRKCFITNFSTFFGFNRTLYSFNVQVFLPKRSCFFSVFFLVNDLLWFTTSNFVKLFFMPLRNNCMLFFLRFFDTNLFLEKKTNSGLYDLVNNLNYKFFFKCGDLELCYIFLALLKIF